MGIVNATPDSFSDGGELARIGVEKRVASLLAAGAEWLDIGAESTRPGAPDVPPETQLERLQPVLSIAVASGVPVSVDTASPEVAQAVLAQGVHCINDVSCLREPELALAVASAGAWLILSHSRAPQTTMSGYSEWPDADYPAPTADVARDWKRAERKALRAGVHQERLIFDPGLGFSKNAGHSLRLLAQLDDFKSLNVPILVGASRKSFLVENNTPAPMERLGASIAAALIAAASGADILRVHDVAETVQALALVRRVGGAALGKKR